ncbi:MAG: hypothetical protein RJB13_104, partial [Pseudomonadota bacterium]
PFVFERVAKQHDDRLGYASVDSHSKGASGAGS